MKKKDEEVEGIHLVLDIAELKISLSPFQLSREYVRIQRALRVVKRRGMSLCSLSGSDGNMEMRRNVSCMYFSNGLYLAGDVRCEQAKRSRMDFPVETVIYRRQ